MATKALKKRQQEESALALKAAASMYQDAPSSEEEDEEDEEDEYLNDDFGDEGEGTEALYVRCWSQTVPPGKSVTLSLEGTELHLTNASLTSLSGSAILSFKTSDDMGPAVLCILSATGQTHALLDASFFSDDETVTFTVEGTAALSLTGSIAIKDRLFEEEEEDMDEEDEEEEDDDEEEGDSVEGNDTKLLVAAEQLSDDEEEEDEEEADDIRVVAKAAPGAPAPEGKAAASAATAAVSKAIESADKLSAAQKLKRKREEGGNAAPAQNGGSAKKQQQVAPAKPNEEAPEGATPKLTGILKKSAPVAAPAASPAAGATKPAAAAAAPGSEKKQAPGSEKKPAQSPAAAAAPAPDAGVQVVRGKLSYWDKKVGNGPTATKGKKAVMTYRGFRKVNGKDITFDSNSNFKFTLGKGEVIKGWDLGIEGMRVGGARRLVIHPELAYGARGSPPEIPPNSTLIFDVELTKVQ